MDDFVVTENTGIEPEGQGEHLWLRLRKTGLSTPEMCKLLSRLSGVRDRDISYAGLKDKHAVTEQWISLIWPIKQEPDWLAQLPAEIELLAHIRHSRKLRKGALRGNRFQLVIRHIACVDPDAVLERIAHIRRAGFPNYFAEQRFGRDGANVSKAKAMFNRSMTVRDRFRRGMFLSAARSWIFNNLLAERVRRGDWDRVIDGDVCQLHGSRAWFVAEAGDADIPRRVKEGDIHPTGPLWGDGDPSSKGEALGLESAIARLDVDLMAGLAAARVDHDRRALRVIPEDLHGEWLDDGSLRLEFGLPAGAYATALLRELGAVQFAGGPATEVDD